MIRVFDYLRTLPELEAEILDAVKRVLHSDRLILGPETEAFEAEFAEFAGVKHCIGVSSGTTAIHLALHTMDLRPGDQVITVANTCVPTISAIRMTGAIPVLVDIAPDTLMMDPHEAEQAITPRTKAIMPVHLWGHGAAMRRLMARAIVRKIPVIEDCAQAHGTKMSDQNVGTFGLAGCYSFYPTKNIGAFGDAGAVVTNDDTFAEHVRRRRFYGYEKQSIAVEEGMNGRIQEIQAAILRIKLRHYPAMLEARRRNAKLYDENVRNAYVERVRPAENCFASYHQYVVRTPHRDAFLRHMAKHDIGCGVHYPMAIHQMPAYRTVAHYTELPNTEAACREVVSLPVHEALTEDEIMQVCKAVREFVPSR